jgi:hypothetical protein
LSVRAVRRITGTGGSGGPVEVIDVFLSKPLLSDSQGTQKGLKVIGFNCLKDGPRFWTLTVMRVFSFAHKT